MTYHVAFLMDQIAGHVTNYKNLRRAHEGKTDFRASWHEIHYYLEGGAIETVRERALPFVSTYVSGIMRGAVEVRKALRQDRYDALFSNVSVGVFFSREFRRTPTLLDFDSTPLQLDRMPSYTPKADPLPLARFKWRLSRKMMHAAWLLQAWSRWARDSAIEDYGVHPDKVIVNPPGVDLTHWRPSERARGSGPRRVLFVGGDFRRKGGEHLLAWFQERRLPDVELHIVTREDVPKTPGVFVYQNVTPNSPELMKLYADADLFVLPSLGECFGIATVEAMATGLPVIASDVGGTADIIEPGRNGFIVPANDVRSLGDAIESILGDRSKQETFGVQSRLLATERFDVVRNAEKTFAYLKELAGKTPRVL